MIKKVCRKVIGIMCFSIFPFYAWIRWLLSEDSIKQAWKVEFSEWKEIFWRKP
jgi:hypothetical protein